MVKYIELTKPINEELNSIMLFYDLVNYYVFHIYEKSVIKFHYDSAELPYANESSFSHNYDHLFTVNIII